jgi:hypothetical protein
MLLEYNTLPGLQLDFSDEQAGEPPSRELPDLLEKFRADYTEDASGRSSMEMLWVGGGCPVNFDGDRKRKIEENGWQIIELYQKVRPPILMEPILPGDPVPAPYVKTLFVVKRRRVEGKVWALQAGAYGKPEDQY